MISKIKNFFRLFRIGMICSLVRKNRMILPESAVILAPHPDDETFGCGQLIAAMCSQGRSVQIIVLSDGSGSHQGCCGISPQDLSKARYESMRRAMAILGVPEDHLHFCGYPDGKLPEILPEHYAELEDLISSLGCESLFAPHPQEGWSDHLAAADLGDHLARRLSMKLHYYCVWFWFSMPFRKFGQVCWKKSMVFGTLKDWEKKLKACQSYRNDLAPCGHPYAGVLPDELFKAITSAREVYFRK